MGTEEYSTPYSDGTASARGGYSRCGGAAEPGVALHYFRTGVLTTLSGRTAHFATNTFGLEGTLRLRAALGLLDLGGQVGLGLLLIREDAFTESEFGEGGRTFVTPAFSVGPVGRLWITEDIGIDLLGDFRLGRSFDSGSGEAFWGSLGLLTGATARF